MRIFESCVCLTLLVGFGGVGCSARLLVEKKSAESKATDGGVDAAIGIDTGGAGGTGGVHVVDTGGRTGDASPGPHSDGGAGGGSVVVPDADVTPPEGDAGPFQCRYGSDPPPPLWTGNSPECPATPPPGHGDCAHPGLNCAYPKNDDGGIGPMLRCMPLSRTRNVWYRLGVWDPPYGSCPLTQPVDGTACPSPPPEFTYCPYPNGVGFGCSCEGERGDGGTLTWNCETHDIPWLVHPDTLDENVRISELTDRERRKWCEWFSCLPFDQARTTPLTEPAAPVPVARNGYTRGSSCMTNTNDFSGASYSLARLSIEQCEANLAFSQCGATLFELSDCLLSTIGSGPHPLGCGRYFDTEGCTETIVTKMDAPNCEVRVR